MTREEAKKVLCVIEKRYCTLALDERQALAMAISALEQEPCEDAISRDALKKMLIGLDKWHVKNKQFVNVGLLYDDVFFGIEHLPSVTQKSGKWIL